jgi:DNA-binding beta-propeller fold protein YncE
MDNGNFKRGWGGHGVALSEIKNGPTPAYDWKTGPPPAQQDFAPALHCVHFSVDNLVYVCERGSNQIQVFTKEGKFIQAIPVAASTPSRGPDCGGPGDPMRGMCGTTYNMTFSHDPQQKYIFIADGTNHKVWIHDRKSGAMVGSIGSLGRYPGGFYWIDAIAMDSLGNLYTGEVWTGKRIQKFNLMNGDGVKRFHPHE